jgi:hypothetical protein
MVGEQNSQGQIDRVKILISVVMKRISDGEAPEQIIALYQNLGPTNFTYWAHGFIYGYVSRKELLKSELFKFLKEVCEQN